MNDKKKDGFLLHSIDLEEDKKSKIVFPGWPKRECQILVEKVEKADDEVEEEEAPFVDWKG